MLGMRSSVDPTSNGPGFWSKLENLIGSRSKVSKRFGCAKLGAAPEANAHFRGGWYGYRSGTPYCICAFSSGSPATTVKLWTLNLSTYAWTEITGASTRFATIAYVDFAPTVDRITGNGILIATNGTDSPRTIIGTSTVYVTSAIALPTDYAPTSQHWPHCWFNMQDPANVSYPSRTGAFTAASDTGASTDDNESLVSVDTSTSGTLAIGYSSASALDTVEEDYELFTGASEFQMALAGNGSSRYFGILVRDTIGDPCFGYMNVQVRNNVAATKDIYVQTTIGSVKPTYIPVATGVYLAVFDLTLYMSDLNNYPSLDRLMLSIHRPFPAARTFYILGVYGLGNIKPGYNHVAAIQNSSLGESPGKVAKKVEGPDIRFLGGNKNLGLSLPEGGSNVNIGWYVFISVQNPGTSNTFEIYRKDASETQYAHSATYFSSTPQYKAALDYAIQSDKDFRRKAPSPWNTIGVPAGSSICSAGNRTYIGGNETVNISDLDYPLRFPGIARDDDFNGQVDEDSGTIVQFPGEKVQRIVAMPGSVAGIQPVIVFTDQNMWRIEGFDALSLSTPTRLNSHGTIYRWTVGVHKQSIFYVDAEKKPRVYTGGSESIPLGIWKVEDQFETGDCWNAHGYVWNEQYRVGIRDVSETLKRKIVYYETMTGEWWTHKYTTPDFAWNFLQQTLGTDGGGFSVAHGSKLVGVSDAGVVFELEQAAKLLDDLPTTGTEAITVTLETSLKGDGWKNWRFGKPGVIWELSTGGSLSITLTPLHDNAQADVKTGSLSLETSVVTEAWRYFLSASPESAFPGVDSYGCKVSITGTPTSGKYCRAIVLDEYNKIDGGGADA